MGTKKTALTISSCLLISLSTHAEHVPNACSGDKRMFALIDRPTVGYSPCAVPDKTLLVESGFAYQIITPSGYAHNIPQIEMRFGILNNTEIDFFPPNYYQQNEPLSGFGATSIGLKHVFFFDAHQLFTIQSYITPPSGSQYFGTDKISFLLNGIYSYNYDSGISLSATVGWAGNSAPPIDPTKNYYTFNPVIDIGLPLNDFFSAYIEFYGQSKTTLDQGWGVSMDGGFIFLAQKNITLDVSAGQRIAGYIGGVDHYFGAGVVVALEL